MLAGLALVGEARLRPWAACAGCRRRARRRCHRARPGAPDEAGRRRTVAGVPRSGEVDFGELAARAIAALGDDMDPSSELGLRLDWRIRHLLVDEFQDTSPTQIACWSALPPAGARRRRPHAVLRRRPDAVDLSLPQGRGRPLPARQVAGHRRLALTPLRLSRNNRACAPVVDWINAGFPAAVSARDEPLRGEIRYRPFVATRADLPDAGVTVHALVAAKGDTARPPSRLEAERMVANHRSRMARRSAAAHRRAGACARPPAALVAAIRRHAPAGASRRWRSSLWPAAR
jgi:ATP-dependent helicase/nuclease subunit A